MRVNFRWSWLVAGGLAVATGALLAGPSWAEDLGLDFWNLGHYSEMLQREEDRQAALQSLGLAICSRVEVKAAVVEELRAGRLDLLGAAQQFRDLNQDCPGFDAQRFAWLYPGRDEQERYCHHLLYCVRIAGRDGPPITTTAALARLEREFEHHFGCQPKRSGYPRALYEPDCPESDSVDTVFTAEAAAR